MKNMKIIINCGSTSARVWNPETYSGGGEEQTIILAKLLSSDDRSVTVYNSTLESKYYSNSGIFGVQYEPYSNFHDDECDIYFGWRHWRLFDKRYAKTQILLCHDGPFPNHFPSHQEIANGALNNIDYVCTLNEYHYNLYLNAGCPKEKLFIIPIVIEKNNYLGTVERDWFKCIFVSQPGRGIHKLRDYWPAIKSAVPQATLQPCWWDIQDGHAFIDANESIGILPYKICNHDELNKELASCFCLPYCSTFDGEISPASCLKSQNSKVLPIIIAHGGMECTMGRSGEIYCSEHDFVDGVVKHLLLPQSEKESMVDVFESHLVKHRAVNVKQQWEEILNRNI